MTMPDPYMFPVHAPPNMGTINSRNVSVLEPFIKAGTSCGHPEAPAWLRKTSTHTLI